MPKANRKKKLKNQDFHVHFFSSQKQKPKLKVGKKKAPANNATDTHFKAQSILVPSQSISKHQETSHVLCNKKNQPLSELISLTRHAHFQHRKGFF